MEPPVDPPGISRDRYCSPNVSLETAWAIFVELERFEGQRWEFMFWKGDVSTQNQQPPQPGAKSQSAAVHLYPNQDDAFTFPCKFDASQMISVSPLALRWESGPFAAFSQADNQPVRPPGRLTSAFTGTPASLTVTPLVEFNGKLPSGSVTVQNIYRWARGPVNGAVFVIWNPVDDQWEPLQMECS